MAEAEVGAMPPPAGIVPDFYHGTSLQSAIIIVFSITFALATIFVALRLYTAIRIVRKFEIDDPLVLLSWGVSLTFFIGMVIAMPAGFGKHLWDVTPTQLTGYMDLLLLLAITYIWPPTLTKLAMLALYHRINPFRRFRIYVYLVAGSTFGYTIVFTCLFAGPCNPIAVGGGLCLNNIAISQAVLNILTDFVLIFLPMPMLYHLKMPLKKKIIIGITFTLGSTVVLASIARISYVKAMATNPDVTWTQASAAVWSSVELNLGVICNCILRLKPFVVSHFPSFARSLASSNKLSYERPSGHSRSGPLGWRGDKASTGFKLHSFEQTAPDVATHTRDGDIHVLEEFQVQVDSAHPTPKNGSTDDILEPKA